MRKLVECKRCEKKWRPTSNPPDICAYCKSRLWNKKKKIRTIKDDKSFLKKASYGKILLIFGMYAGERDKLEQADFKENLKTTQENVVRILQKLEAVEE